MSWLLTLRASNNMSLPLLINCSKPFDINTLYILVSNKEDSSSNYFMVNTRNGSGVTLSVNFILSLFGWELYVIGLKTIMGKFDVAVCHGFTEMFISFKNICAAYELHLKECQDIELPLQNPNQGTLPVSIFRQPPSYYRLDVNYKFPQERDFIVFVKFSGQLRCYIIQQRCIFKEPFPFEIPSATAVSCKVICTSRHQNDVGKVVGFAIFSHSQVITFKTLPPMTAYMSWLLTLRASNNMSLPLLINSSKPFDINTLYILVSNKEDSSSNHFIVNTRNVSGVTLSVNLIMSLFGWEVYVIGLKTIMGKFDVAVCHGFTEMLISFKDMCAAYELHLTECQDIELPVQTPNQGTLPVSIFRQPPSYYRLDVNYKFPQERDFIVFVKFSGQLRCYIIQQCCIFKEPFPFEIPSATTVSCKVFCTSRHQNDVGKVVGFAIFSHSQVITFKTFLTLIDMYRLYNLAMDFGSRRVTANLKPIQYFYRNKSVEYFKVILDQLGGEMRPYLKSNGGEQGSVLNGRLPGLFFSTYLDPITNLPNPSSHYGPIRLYVNALAMFIPTCNLYFADFYCHYKRHHVTIVLTPKTSSCNIFCRQYLPQLNIYNNPYLCLQATPLGTFYVVANMDVTTEVFYTETINVRNILVFNMGKIEETGIIGRGFAPPKGIPKNVACTYCNLK